MGLIRDKVFFGISAIILAIFIVVPLFGDLSDSSKDFYPGASNSFLLLFNLVIALSWFAFGWIGGMLFLILAVIITLILPPAMRSNIYYIHFILFSGTSLFSYTRLRKFTEFKTSHLLKKEKLSESINMLTEKLERDRSHMNSLELKLTRYEALKNVAEDLGDIFLQEKIVKFLSDKSFEIVSKSARSLVYLVDIDKQELVLTHSMQPDTFPTIKTKKGDIFDKWVLKQNQPLIVLEANKDFRFPHDDILSREFNFKSLISVPMISHNKVVGLLRLDSEKTNAYNPDDLRLLDTIGDLGAIAINNNMLYTRMNELAIRDGLTGLFVHRYFMERLESELVRAFEKNHTLSVLMIDIDHFKEYNDKYGHIAGDLLLKHLAGIFTSISGKGNIVARYGGEEFAIILFEEDKKGAAGIAEKIRDAVESEPFYLRRAKTKATVSIGVAAFPNDAKSGRELLRMADQSLYKAKKEGRNKVCTD